ncbi:putative transcriptional regulatory protein (plasmid) [Sphingobium sp. RAC03]|nr:putative transcriptional regulatory protein [Sphingobium sp. RAC03]
MHVIEPRYRAIDWPMRGNPGESHPNASFAPPARNDYISNCVELLSDRWTKIKHSLPSLPYPTKPASGSCGCWWLSAQTAVQRGR